MKANFLYYYRCWYLKRKFIVHEIFDIIPNGKFSYNKTNGTWDHLSLKDVFVKFANITLRCRVFIIDVYVPDFTRVNYITSFFRNTN